MTELVKKEAEAILHGAWWEENGSSVFARFSSLSIPLPCSSVCDLPVCLSEKRVCGFCFVFFLPPPVNFGADRE